jgi:hypothetical protein
MKAHREVRLLSVELSQFGANDSDVLDCYGHYSNIAIDAKCRPIRPGRQEARRARWLLGLEIEMSLGVVSQTGAHFVVGTLPRKHANDIARIKR